MGICAWLFKAQVAIMRKIVVRLTSRIRIRLRPAQ
jgi:hypothetical protein